MLAKSALIALVFGFCLPAPTLPPQETRPALVRSASPSPQRVSFDDQIRPLLEKRCQPCHFPGGKMYARLPFDRPETVRTLGEKLFTRIRNEREQSLLRSFLAQEATGTGKGGA
jgi:hypothetical protein